MCLEWLNPSCMAEYGNRKRFATLGYNVGRYFGCHQHWQPTWCRETKKLGENMVVGEVPREKEPRLRYNPSMSTDSTRFFSNNIILTRTKRGWSSNLKSTSRSMSSLVIPPSTSHVKRRSTSAAYKKVVHWRNLFLVPTGTSGKEVRPRTRNGKIHRLLQLCSSESFSDMWYLDENSHYNAILAASKARLQVQKQGTLWALWVLSEAIDEMKRWWLWCPS